MNFIQSCLSGDLLQDEIDDFVAKWHESPDVEEELYEFLGMTWEEYSIWATSPSILPYIIAARRNGSSLETEIEQTKVALAARAGSVEEAMKMQIWLRKIGKL